jgi:hypothetical protein
MDVETALSVSWHACRANCGHSHPVNPTRDYCCSTCSAASLGRYTLDFHTAECDERQRFHRIAMSEREQEQKEGRNGTH